MLLGRRTGWNSSSLSYWSNQRTRVHSTTKMHILIVTQYFYPETFGINDIAFDLVARGHEVTVLTGMPNYPSGRIEPGYGGLRIRRESIRSVSVIRVPIVPRGRATFSRLGINYLSFAVGASALGPFLLPRGIDVILVYQVS